MPRKSAPRLTIAVDLDDVLGDFARAFVDYSNQKWGTKLEPDDWTEHLIELWRVDEAEAQRRVEFIHANPGQILNKIKHDSSAVKILQKLSHQYKLVIVTSRRRILEKETLLFVNRYFRGIFQDVHFAGIWDDLDKPLSERLNLTKAEIVSQIGAGYLIDDQPKHCIAAADAGIKALLFGDYKWNRDIKLQTNMVRVKNWTEVWAYFNAEGWR